MANFTLNASLKNGATPEEFLVGETYNQDIKFTVSNFTGDDRDNIQKVVLYHNGSVLGSVDAGPYACLDTSKELTIKTLNANVLGIENDKNAITAIAYDMNGNKLGSATSDISTMLLPAWINDEGIKVSNWQEKSDGSFFLDVEKTIFDKTCNWLGSINIAGKVYDLSWANPRFNSTATFTIVYDGKEYKEYENQETSFGALGLLFSNKHEHALPSHSMSVGEKEFEFDKWGIKAGVELSKDLTSEYFDFSFTVEGEYKIGEKNFLEPVTPIPTPIPGLRIDAAVEIGASISVGGTISVKNGKIGGAITVKPTITGTVKIAGDLGIGKFSALTIGGFGTVSGSMEISLSGGSAATAPMSGSVSIAAGAYVDALTFKVAGFKFKAFGYKFTAIDHKWSVSAGSYLSSSASSGYSEGNKINDTGRFFDDCKAVWNNDDNGCTFSAKVEAPLSLSKVGYYDVVLKYAEYDAKNDTYGEIQSIKVADIHDNACFAIEKTLQLDKNKTYAYVFAILPAADAAFDNDIAVEAKSDILSSSEVNYTLPQISIENIIVQEPEVGTTKATFVAKLSNASKEDISFRWTTNDGTAVSGKDFNGMSGVVTFAAGETEKEFEITILADEDKEPKEEFTVSLYANGDALFDSSIAPYDNKEAVVKCVIEDADKNGAAAVTVIDVSGSMSGNKIVSAKNAAYSFINNMNIGDYIGVVSFASSASTRYSLTQITSESTKSAAKSAVSGLYASGGTFIGSGIQQAANMLNGVDSEQKSIIVMTDGEDGNRTRTNNIVKNLPKDQYLIYGIGYGTQASAAVDALSVINSDITLSTSYASKTYMEELMDMCGGKYYYAATDEDLEDIYFELSARSSKQQIISKFSDEVEANDISVNSIMVDLYCTTVRIGINWTSGNLDLELWDPNGNHYNSTVDSDKIKFVSTGTSEYYEITAPTRGVWGISVNGTRISGDSEMYDLYAITSSTIEANLDFDATRVAPNQQITVSCTVKNGNNNVLGASVYAKVLDSKGDYEFVDLFDDGMHGDGIANDGVYGNIISKDSAGVYKVTGYVEGTATMGDVFYRQTVEEQFQVDVNAKASLISVMGNFGGNGKTAIVQYDYAKSLNVTGWFAQEDGSMKWQFINTVAPGWEISKMTGDFTGDGSDDIMWINKDSGHIGTWQMDNGSCKWSILTITDFDDWSLQGIGDFNGDGTDDMLFRNRLNGLVGTLDTKNGEQVPSSWKVLNGTTDAWQIAGTGDFNGDKKDDILLTNTVTGQVGIWEMTAQGTTNWKSVSFTDFAEWRIQGIGDFNGDDVDDILFANNTTGVVGFWGMENGANKDWTLIGIADVKSDWQISGIGDFNDDGIDEIAWTSPTSERIGCWTQDKEKLAQWSILA